jgi:REP element-mobilizing transposase RayT
MSRGLRIFIPGGIYHVYCRVARGEDVFLHGPSADDWTEAAARVSRLHNVTILAWCLMSNHYHLVLQTGTIPLWRPMAQLQGRVAILFNRRHQVAGRLWQSRYKARLIEDSSGLKRVIAYVHLNPVAAGVVDDPARYEHSGHREVLGLAEHGLCAVRSTLLCFDERTATARVAYQKWMRAVAEARWLSNGVRDLPWWRRVKDDDETAPRDRPPAGSRDYSGQPMPLERSRRPPLSSVLELFEQEAGIGPGVLRGRSRTRTVSWHRRQFVTFAVSWLGYPSNEVASALDKASGSVSRWLSQGLELQRSDPGCREALHSLAVKARGRWGEPGVSDMGDGRQETL